MKISTKISVCALFCLLGFFGNWFKLTLFFNVDFLFGSFFTMLAIMVVGGTCGAIVGIVAGTCTYILWNHPWAIIIFAAEAIFVASVYSKRKGNLIIYDILYWVCLGIPIIYLFYHHLMGMQLQSTLVVMLKQSINGLFNVLMASLALIVFQFVRRAPGIRLPHSQVLFVVMVSLVLLPSTFLMVSGMRTYQEKRIQSIEASVSSVSEAARKILADWIQVNHRTVRILSTLVGDPNASTYEDMQHYVEIVKAASPAFKGMGVFNKSSITVSYSPLEEGGKSTLGVDFSYRPHVANMRSDKKPYITDVLMSKLGHPSPIVIFLAPVIISGEYEGYCSGVVKVDQILSLIRNIAGQGIHITVADGRNRVIVSTITDLNTMDLFPRPYGQIDGKVDSVTNLWKPNPKPNISRMLQWKNSFYYRFEPLLDISSWRVIVEASCQPLVEDISRYSLSRLGLLGLLILLAVALSHLLSNGFISSVVKLQALTRSLPARLGDAVNIRWPESKIAELDDLSNNFREMAAALVADITARNKMEEELRYKNILLATQQEVSIEGILVVDGNDRIVSYNRRFVEIWGISPELLRDEEGRAILKVVSKKVVDPKAFVETVQYLYKHRDETCQTDIILADGQILEHYSAPMFVEDRSSYLGRVWYFRDVTEQKQAETGMRDRIELQAQIARVAVTVPGMIYSFQMHPNGSTCMPFATEKIKELCGLSPEDVREDFSPAYALVHPDDLGHLQESIAESARTMRPWRNTFRVRHPEKSELWVEGHSLPQADPDGSIVWHGFVMDITELKRAEDKFRVLFESSSDGIVIAEVETKQIKYVNPAICRFFGYSATEFESLKIADIHPKAELPKIVANFEKQALGENTLTPEIPCLRKDGYVVYADINAVPIMVDGRACLSAFFRDITDRKLSEQEREKLQAQLIQAQKMESVGRLAGGVAHDYNNILSIILGYTEMALYKDDLDEELLGYLQEIHSSAIRSRDITRQLLAFARKQAIDPKVLDLNVTIENMLRILRRLIGEDIDLAWLPGKTEWPVLMDPSQIDQILANLCVNARDAISDVGKVTIETSTVTINQEYCSNHPGFVPGDFVVLSVSDDGCGMDRDTLDQIFEPFFTTKGVGKGTGLGLATVYGIVKQNKGFINVYSEQNEGTTFRIYLPRYAGVIKEDSVEVKMAPVMGRGEGLLVVEDDISILRMAEIILSKLNYKVLTANTPSEALHLAEVHNAEIDLLITDVVMPGMNGRELATQLRATLFPNLKCLYMSGYTANVIAHHGVLDKGFRFIQKPFSTKDLAEKVRAALDAN